MNYSLNSIIKEYLIEIGDSNLSRYARFYQYAISGLRELNMDTNGIIKVTQLAVNPNDTADLPNDYLNYTRIGICGNDGQIHSLGKNDNLTLNKLYNNCGVPINPANQNQAALANNLYTNSFFISNDYLSDNVRNGEMMGRFFGLGGGNNVNGYFRVDSANNQLVLGNLICHTQSLALEYIADITSVDDDFEVHPFIIETLKSWIFWKSIQRNQSRSLGEKEQAKQDFYREERLSARRINSNTMSEWLESLRAGNKSVAKW